MATFVYAPRVTAHVAVTNRQGQQQILDLSEDLVNGSVTLRERGVHTFNFQLQNAQRKYDGLIRPMDRIVVAMSRFGAPLRVMSGYMNNGPVFSVWPRVLTMSASCTLKKLQFWYWDSQSVASQNLLQTFAGQAGTTTSADGGLREMVIKLLVEVVGWPAEKIHIGAIPNKWFEFATEVGDEIVKASEMSDLIGTLGAGAAIGGSGLAGSGSLSAGVYAGTRLDADQAKNATTIFNVAAGRKLPPKAVVVALAAAMTESNLRNVNYGDRDSLGLFQMRPSMGWGTPEQVTDPVYASNKFYDVLLAIPNWENMAVGAAAQAVERSAFPDRYAQHEAMARAATESLLQSAQGLNRSNAGSVITGSGGSDALQGARASGRNIASVAFTLIKSKPPGHIRYQLGNDSAYNDPDPRVLDCSSLVDWVYYNAVGRPLVPNGRSTTYTLDATCQRISVATALATKGALLHNGPGHVEVSLGNSMTAGAHTDGIPLDKQVTVGPTSAGQWTHGNLLPGINYSDAATTPAAAAELKQRLGYNMTTSSPDEFGENAQPGTANPGGGGVTDPFNALLNVYVWGFIPASHGDVFAGPRAMMNDDPILPYISNLLSSSMRSWCSAPNGDFMAWFPDYFDIWGITAKMNVRSIELLDFTVDWIDQEIVTHQYVIGIPTGIAFNTADASISAQGAGEGSDLFWKLNSQGVATMDFPQIFRAIFGQDASEQFVRDYLSRFGGRPNMITIPSITQGRPEFFMALYLFMQRWANQFRTEVPMTFMPELYPGMILALEEFGFQAYVTEVTHSFQFGKGGYFRTDAQVVAPARTIPGKPEDRTTVFGLLPLGGKRYTSPPEPRTRPQPTRPGLGQPNIPI